MYVFVCILHVLQISSYQYVFVCIVCICKYLIEDTCRYLHIHTLTYTSHPSCFFCIVCMRMYLYVCVCICFYNLYVHVFCLYWTFICMYGLDFHWTQCKVPKKQHGEAGPSGLDSIQRLAWAHIILSVFWDHDPDRFWRTGSQNTRRGGSKHISVAVNTHHVGKWST